MPIASPDTVDEIIAGWRNTAGAGNPAGPLYAAGKFAEADIIAPDMLATFARCSAGGTVCTAWRTMACC